MPWVIRGLTCYLLMFGAAACVWAQGDDADVANGLSEPVDLLAELDPVKHAVAGTWKAQQGFLESPVGARARFELAAEPPAEYQLELDVERVRGKDAFAIGLVYGGKQVMVMIDGYGGQFSGLHLLDGIGCDKNTTSYRQPVFAEGKSVTIRCIVREGGISVWHDEQPLFVWHGAPKQLDLWEGWKVRNSKSLFLGAHESAYRVTNVKLSPPPKLIEVDPAIPVAAPTKAPRPIPSDQRAYDGRKFERDMIAFFNRQIDDYRKQTSDPEAVREEVDEFLSSVIAGRLTAGSKWASLLAEGERLSGQGAGDPLFKSALADCHQYAGSETDELRLRGEAAAGFAKTPYPPFWQLHNAKRWVELVYVSSDQARNRALQTAIRAAAAAVNDRGIQAPEQRFVAVYLTPMLEQFQPGDRAALYEQLAIQPDMDSWTKNLLAGIYHVKLAWQHRGGGWAGEVTPEGWQQFRNNMQAAAWFLSKAWSDRPEFPEPATQMIAVAMAGASQATPRQWFDEAVAAQMDYEPAYRALTLALRPRWGGSHAEMLELAEDCVATKRFDTLVPYMAIKIVEEIAEDMRDRRETIWKHPRFYNLARRALDGMAADPTRADGQPQDMTRSAIQSKHLVIAIDANQLDDARRLVEDLGDNLQESVFAPSGGRPKFAVSRVYAMAGKHRRDLEAAEKLIFPANLREVGDNRTKAMELYTKLLAENDDARAELYLRSNHDMLAREIQYATGEWVQLNFDEGLELYRKSGRWREQGGTLVGEFSGSGGLWLTSTSAFQPPVEMIVEIEHINPRRMANAGMFVGSPGQQFGGLFFWTDPRRKRTGANEFFDIPTGIDLAQQKVNTLHARVWGDEYEVYINGTHLTTDLEQPLQTDGVVGLGSMFWLTMEGGQVRYRNWRVRKLDSPPPPALNQHEACVDYFTRLIDEFPEYPRPWIRRSVARYELGQYDAAVPDARQALKLHHGIRLGHYWLAVCLQKTGDQRGALAAAREELRLAPNSPFVQEKLADLYGASAEPALHDAKLAIEHGLKANELSGGKNWSVVLILGTAYARAGDFDQALKHAHQALELAPDDEARETIQERIQLFEQKQPFQYTLESEDE